MNGKYKCNYCGKTYGVPLTHIYEYEGIDSFYTSYPKTEIMYCNDCKKFVCVQKGVNYSKVLDEIKHGSQDRAKHLYGFLNMLNGRNTKDACVECNGGNLVDKYTFFCPDCGIGSFEYIKPEESDIRIRYGKKIIKPVFESKQLKANSYRGKSLRDNDSIREGKDYKWIKIIIKNIVIGFVVIFLSDMFRDVPVHREFKDTIIVALLMAIVYPFFKWPMQALIQGFVKVFAKVLKIKTEDNEDFMSLLSHVVTIVLISMFTGNLDTQSDGYDYENYNEGPNSRVEQFLGL